MNGRAPRRTEMDDAKLRRQTEVRILLESFRKARHVAPQAVTSHVALSGEVAPQGPSPEDLPCNDLKHEPPNSAALKVEPDSTAQHEVKIELEKSETPSHCEKDQAFPNQSFKINLPTLTPCEIEKLAAQFARQMFDTLISEYFEKYCNEFLKVYEKRS